MTPLVKNKPVVFHFRYNQSKTNPLFFSFEGYGPVHNMGGVTVVFNPEKRMAGVAVCSLSDNFCKQKGYRMALARANGTGHYNNKYSELEYLGELTYEAVKKAAKELAVKFSQESRH